MADSNREAIQGRVSPLDEMRERQAAGISTRCHRDRVESRSVDCDLQGCLGVTRGQAGTRAGRKLFRSPLYPGNLLPIPPVRLTTTQILMSSEWGANLDPVQIPVAFVTNFEENGLEGRTYVARDPPTTKFLPPHPCCQSTGEAPIRFGGTPATPAPEVFEKARQNNPVWYQIAEEAYRQLAQSPENRGVYADPEVQGAALEQVWRVFTLFGVETYCVLARTMPDDQVKGISRLEQRSPEELVNMLRKLHSVSGEINAPTLHYDGATGHCIRITAYDPQRDRFIYHDPWPADSLLCKENNLASVAAQPEGGRWSVTSEELERVIFASYIFPTQWARLNGVDFDLIYDRWQASEFFRFFHLRLLAEDVENGRKRQSFTAGPFKDNVSVVVECANGGKITWSGLVLSQDWTAANLILAIDIAKSFVLAFAPSPDRAMFAEIGRALWQLKDANFIKALPCERSDNPAIRCVQAFLGGIESVDVQTDFGLLSIKNSNSGGKNRVELAFSLF